MRRIHNAASCVVDFLLPSPNAIAVANTGWSPAGDRLSGSRQHAFTITFASPTYGQPPPDSLQSRQFPESANLAKGPTSPGRLATSDTSRDKNHPSFPISRSAFFCAKRRECHLVVIVKNPCDCSPQPPSNILEIASPASPLPCFPFSLTRSKCLREYLLPCLARLPCYLALHYLVTLPCKVSPGLN